ncbi:hypothetical protein IWX75_000711 [Arthrobacter sp. CAN_A6]|uniref:hypothetical protein n=1 Tax=Arthrobacter sp. CAN_A6 TaxID=2787721 RepID=UPI0018C93E70
MERDYPGWHGIPPSADRFIPPIQLDEPAEPIHWTNGDAPAVWCDLTYPDGAEATAKGFAKAWTTERVLVHWVEFSGAREAWVSASACRPRELPNRARHRDG